MSLPICSTVTFLYLRLWNSIENSKSEWMPMFFPNDLKLQNLKWQIGADE
ncbi:Uncharacterised protein [Vibrio cholerae]|nr:Uncharacterised protein [Vibrio cholerae]CSI53933.1 Uncharacterised protein [Vibrio cholerae]CSI59678.1 Uncharacterised protein [Vibrio cholerae]